jgi:glyoxylate reductase
MQVRYWSRARLPAERELQATWCDSLAALVSTSDFVSLHCPATSETRHLIDSAALAHFRPHAYLINTSRGDVVDEVALCRALRQGTLAGAALDVFDGEPRVSPEVLSLPTVVTLPHLGSATVESRVAMGQVALRNIAAFVAGEPLPDRVC